MKLIRTRWVGPTKTKPSRVIADDGEIGAGHRLIVSPDPASKRPDRDAAIALVARLGWGHYSEIEEHFHQNTTYWLFR